MRVEKAAGIGFCLGVRRAIDILEKVASERRGVETLGALVHNHQVLSRLAGLGVRAADGIDDIHGDAVVIGAHGISPDMENELRSRQIEIINTTCPFVHRAQKVAHRLDRSGFMVIVFGDANHPEVRGILGWAGGNGLATHDTRDVASLEPMPRRLGVLAQTTQIPARFTGFVGELMGSVLRKDSEVRTVDTICHDIRRRQAAAMEVAGRVDLMMVTGDRTSANTNRLAELCSTSTPTHLIETAGDIQSGWLQGCPSVGITGGASTAEDTINQVLARLEAIAPES